MDLRFDWNEEKALANLKKHGVSFSEATTVFGDPLSVTITAPDHSEGEERSIMVGMSRWSRLLVVVHAEENDEIRIISARLATRNERRDYEQE